MNKLSRKIHAFTLSDVLVALAISSILYGIIYMAISLITNNIGSIKNNFVQGDALQLVEQQLTLDFNTYPSVLYNNFDNRLVFSSPLDSIVYKFEEDYVMRSQDTLAVRLQKKIFFFKGEVTQKGVVDGLQLNCIKEKEMIPLFIFKKNDAYTLLKNGT